MKKIICFIAIVCLINVFGFSNNPIEHTHLTVVAGSGIKLRVQPSLQSHVIKVIPYGDHVEMRHDSVQVEDRIEWLDGKWIKIEHEGDTGYVFDGFLSTLPTPTLDFELSQEDLAFIPALDSWASYRFSPTAEAHTIERAGQIKVITPLEGGHKKIELETPYMYKLSVQLQDKEIHEAYNLLRGMLLTDYELATFNRKTLFIENNVGDIHKIKVALDEPIEIKKLPNNRIQISVISFHEGCKL